MNKRKAIITGSINYIESPLEFPSKDIDLMSSTLIKRCLFQKEDIEKIMHTKDISDVDYIQKIKRICNIINNEKTDAYDLILFYYSGHGIYIEEEKKSFLQISDNEQVSIDEIIQIVSEVKAKNKYFIIDACQSGGYSLMKPKGKLDRKYTYNSESIYCMFGTTKNLQAFEPTIKEIKNKINNSFYTHFIIEALNSKSNYTDGTISIKVVDDYASRKTPTRTNFEQIPFSTTQVAGFFPFGFWDEIEPFENILDLEDDTNNLQNDEVNQELEIVNWFLTTIQDILTKNKYVYISDNTLLSKLSQSSKKILNENLDLVHKKYNNKPLVNGLISSGKLEKMEFLIFILKNSEINIDISLKDDYGNTALFEAINYLDYDSSRIIQLLFLRGYIVTIEERNSLTTEFEKTDIHPKKLENITIALIYYKLKDKNLIEKMRKIERIILAFISVKTKKVIGYNFNHLALANHILNRYQEYSTQFIKLLKINGLYDDLKSKTSFINKINSIQSENLYQEHEYDDVMTVLFPELFEE